MKPESIPLALPLSASSFVLFVQKHQGNVPHQGCHLFVHESIDNAKHFLCASKLLFV